MSRTVDHLCRNVQPARSRHQSRTPGVDAPAHRYEPDPAAAPELLAALREDRLAAWVAAHPERVTGLR
ncbi:hypothetical protein ACH4T9_22785 [Micromonospora sp. NPDC020750]|uniref:hypothetical protein n=1 Tax=unclassified Micromonospora TaxID=2617518 RepID=UPI0037B2F6FA